MEHIKFKKKLKTLDKIGEITKVIVEKIQGIPKFNEELRNDLELILHVCVIVENEFNQTSNKTVNKKQIVIDILTKVFLLRPDEISNLEKHIEFLHSNNQIRKIPKYEKIGLQVAGWFFRRFC